MHILNKEEIREWDQYTIQHEPIASIDLMERAATESVKWLERQLWKDKSFRIFCGHGNNGGDGLAIARILVQKGYSVFVYILESDKEGKEDFQINLKRLQTTTVPIHSISSPKHFPSINSGDILIDALFGSGLSHPLKDIPSQLVEYLNHLQAIVVSIDLPSGLFVDVSSKGNSIVKADYTLTFQCYKTGLMMQENAPFTGLVQVLNIGLCAGFLKEHSVHQHLIDAALARSIYTPRNAYAHKGAFGHALIIAGSYGKMGAATLTTKACVHSGAGLTTVLIPKSGYTIMQLAVPEAMVITDATENFLATLPDEIEKYTVVGMGPGMGTHDETQKLLSFIIHRYQRPLVIDADGLNCLSLQPHLLHRLPPYSILTPHPKEFDRLFGPADTDFERIKTARQKAQELQIIIILKGHHSFIATPGGECYFNSTGNAGMAKGGSGDVLTGIITALIAQGYAPVQAALLGVYIHGYAGDAAAPSLSLEAMVASDLIRFLSQAFLNLNVV